MYIYTHAHITYILFAMRGALYKYVEQINNNAETSTK